jgi:hypothetical protein
MGWAVSLVGFARFGQGWTRSLRSVASAVTLGAVFLFGAWFVRERMAIYGLGGELLWQTTQRISESPASERHLVVNYPAWLAPGRLVYPLGHEGVEFVPSFAGVGDLVWSNSGATRSVRAASFGNSLPESPGYYYGVRGPEVSWEGLAASIREVDSVHLAHIGAQQIWLRTVGSVDYPAASPATPVAVFDGRVQLISATGQCGGGENSLCLVWQADGQLIDADYRIFAHALAADERILSQDDGYPVGGLFPFWIWHDQERVEEERFLGRGCIEGDGVVGFAVGIYDPATGARLPAVGADGSRFDGDAVPIPCGE